MTVKIVKTPENLGQPSRMLLLGKNMLHANSAILCTDKSMLGDVCGWWVLNSMQFDKIRLLASQSAAWRKILRNTCMKKHNLFQLPEMVDRISAAHLFLSIMVWSTSLGTQNLAWSIGGKNSSPRPLQRHFNLRISV